MSQECIYLEPLTEEETVGEFLGFGVHSEIAQDQNWQSIGVLTYTVALIKTPEGRIRKINVESVKLLNC